MDARFPFFSKNSKGNMPFRPSALSSIPGFQRRKVITGAVRRLRLHPDSVHPINFSKSEQKSPWFLKLNPNGRIPILVDTNRGDFTVFDSAAILLYLGQHYDTQFEFCFDPSNEHSEMLQWIFFVV